MLQLKKTKLIHIVLALTFLLSSCYEDFLVIQSSFSNGHYLDSNRVVFFHTIKASQPPKGISRFPDGGTHKTIYKNTSVYQYNIQKKELYKINDFGNLPFNSWNDYISIHKNKILYSTAPSLGWDWRIANSTRKDEFLRLKNEIGGIFLYTIDSLKNEKIIHAAYYPLFSPNGEHILYLKKDTNRTEIIVYNTNIKNTTNLFNTPITNRINSLFWINENEIFLKINDDSFLFDIQGNKKNSPDLSNKQIVKNKLETRKLKEILNDITYADWGFELKKYWNKDIDDFCNDIVLLNGNLEYRKTILEEYHNVLSKKEIEDMLNKIEERKQELEYYKKTEYEIFSEETVILLQELLKTK